MKYIIWLLILFSILIYCKLTIKEGFSDEFSGQLNKFYLRTANNYNTNEYHKIRTVPSIKDVCGSKSPIPDSDLPIDPLTNSFSFNVNENNAVDQSKYDVWNKMSSREYNTWIPVPKGVCLDGCEYKNTRRGWYCNNSTTPDIISNKHCKENSDCMWCEQCGI
mgnify:CR=1 FL=1|tara:strand:- start:110 stop:598 length:489 start_codon:yes stop_codon:yes gene_type:complete